MVIQISHYIYEYTSFNLKHSAVSKKNIFFRKHRGRGFFVALLSQIFYNLQSDTYCYTVPAAIPIYFGNTGFKLSFSWAVAIWV